MRDFIATIQDATGETRELKIHACSREAARTRLEELGYSRILWIL